MLLFKKERVLYGVFFLTYDLKAVSISQVSNHMRHMEVKIVFFFAVISKCVCLQEEETISWKSVNVCARAVICFYCLGCFRRSSENHRRALESRS